MTDGDGYDVEKPLWYKYCKQKVLSTQWAQYQCAWHLLRFILYQYKRRASSVKLRQLPCALCTSWNNLTMSFYNSYYVVYRIQRCRTTTCESNEIKNVLSPYCPFHWDVYKRQVWYSLEKCFSDCTINMWQKMLAIGGNRAYDSFLLN